MSQETKYYNVYLETEEEVEDYSGFQTIEEALEFVYQILTFKRTSQDIKGYKITKVVEVDQLTGGDWSDQDSL